MNEHVRLTAEKVSGRGYYTCSFLVHLQIAQEIREILLLE